MALGLGVALAVTLLVVTALVAIVLLQAQRVTELRTQLSASGDWIRRMGGEYRQLAELALHRDPPPEPIIVPPPPIPPFPTPAPPPDLAAIVRAVTEGYASVVNPVTAPVDPASPEGRAARGVSYGDLHPAELSMTERSRREFFPDVEFDTMMGEDPNAWPTRGGWVAGSPNPDGLPVDTATRTELREWRKGTGPMFQAGTSGEPPTGGMEPE